MDGKECLINLFIFVSVNIRVDKYIFDMIFGDGGHNTTSR